MSTLNFNTTKKQYLTIVLPDENNTTLMVCMPTKALFEELDSIKSNLINGDSGDNLDGILGDLYDIVARIMSRNKGGIEITRERLESCLDFEDIVVFFNAYIAFVNSARNLKN